jgi:hypothetical protein
VRIFVGPSDFDCVLVPHYSWASCGHLEWARRPPGKRSLKTMRILREKYAWPETIVGRHSPLPIPKERQRVYAPRFRRRRSSDIPQLPVFRQQLEAICFATVPAG